MPKPKPEITESQLRDMMSQIADIQRKYEEEIASRLRSLHLQLAIAVGDVKPPKRSVVFRMPNGKEVRM